jgi:T-complex protein 1 subunit gamma
MGGIVLSNDGHAILREVEVKHPAAKSMLEISRAQDEEVGDGTTSVIVLAGEMMVSAQPFIMRELHPTIIVKGYYRALQDGLKVLREIASPLNFDDDKAVQQALFCCVGTKFAARWKDMVVNLAIKSTRIVMKGSTPQKLTLDVKRYAKVEKIPGGALDESEVLDGVMFNKDLVHPKMRREIRNPRVILLDSPLEYKKGESQTSMEMTKETDMTDALQ